MRLPGQWASVDSRRNTARPACWCLSLAPGTFSLWRRGRSDLRRIDTRSPGRYYNYAWVLPGLGTVLSFPGSFSFLSSPSPHLPLPLPLRLFPRRGRFYRQLMWKESDIFHSGVFHLIPVVGSDRHFRPLLRLPLQPFPTFGRLDVRHPGFVGFGWEQIKSTTKLSSIFSACPTPPRCLLRGAPGSMANENADVSIQASQTPADRPAPQHPRPARYA